MQVSKTSPCPIPFHLRRSWFILKGYRFFEMLLSYERNFGGTGMAGKVIARTISTANNLNPTLKKQNWKLSPAHLTIKYVYSPLSPPCSHDCFFYIISSVTISSPPSPVAPSFEWVHLFPEEMISHLPSACVQGQLFHMAWQSTALRQQLRLGPEHTVLSLTCHRHTRHHVPRALLSHGTHSRQSTTLEWPKAWLRSCYNTDHLQGKLLIQYFSMYGKEQSQNTVHTGLVMQQI